MTDAARNRLRLWLRSERALGLTSVSAGGPMADFTAPLGPGSPMAADEPSGDLLDDLGLPEPPTGTAADSSRPARPVGPTPPAPATASAAATPDASLFGVGGGDAAGLVLPDPSLPPFTAPPLSADDKRERLRAMDENEVKGCTRCRLCETRTNTVFGEGDADARVFFIGEGPGENEDRTGRPFVGRAGELLNKQVAAMGLKREQVFIANTVKCRPPGNREPAPDEVATCTPYLVRQLEIVRPRVIVTLGRPATQYMLQSKQAMSRLRGQWHKWRGIKLMPTFHPAFLLRQYTEQNRAAVWDDLKKVMAELGLPVKPSRG